MNKETIYKRLEEINKQYNSINYNDNPTLYNKLGKERNRLIDMYDLLS